MRSYPRNSPQAATRILALAMLADGHQCASELAAKSCSITNKLPFSSTT